MHVFYINLDRRSDRRGHIENELRKMNISGERFPAISHQMGALGCTKSHLAVLKLARERDYDSVCIFEDDFEFLVSEDEYNNVLKQIPVDFDVVMLGWYIIQSVPYDITFGKVITATTASGYIVNKKFYDTLINNIEKAVHLFEANIHTYGVVAKYINDQYWKHIQPHAKWLYTLKRIGKQTASYSDLVGAQVAYDY